MNELTSNQMSELLIYLKGLFICPIGAETRLEYYLEGLLVRPSDAENMLVCLGIRINANSKEM